MLEKSAKAVSLLVNPFTNLTPALAVLFIGGVGGVSGKQMNLALGVGILFGTVLPALYVLRLKNNGEIGELDVQDTNLRLKPLAFGVASYFIGFALMAVAGAGGIPLGLMFCYATNTLVVLVISRWWKISIHAMGISGPLVACQLAFGAVVYPWWGLLPLVAASRVYLGRHTGMQVTAGALLGVVLTVIQLQWLFI